MFEAIVIFCAIQSAELPPRCLPLKDTWGPFKTEENCNIRTNQMVKEILEDEEKVKGIIYLLGSDKLFYVKQCKAQKGEQA